jgi:hypothetical protein
VSDDCTGENEIANGSTANDSFPIFLRFDVFKQHNFKNCHPNLYFLNYQSGAQFYQPATALLQQPPSFWQHVGTHDSKKTSTAISTANDNVHRDANLFFLCFSYFLPVLPDSDDNNKDWDISIPMEITI